MKTNKTLLVVKVLSLLITISFVLTTFIIPSGAVSPDSNDPRVMVSLGDSYASGESIEQFYGQEKDLKERVKDHNWLAHRSKRSWSAMLSVPGLEDGKTMGNYWCDNYSSNSSVKAKWYFKAASGAQTKHFYEKQKNIQGY